MNYLAIGCLVGGLVGLVDGRFGFIAIAIGALLSLIA